jgi:hypothetical protein
VSPGSQEAKAAAFAGLHAAPPVLTLTRERFEDLIEVDVQRSLRKVEDAIRQAVAPHRTGHRPLFRYRAEDGTRHRLIHRGTAIPVAHTDSTA